MASGKAPSQLASAQTLTGSYVITSTIGAFSIVEESEATVDVSYTTGSGETNAYITFKVEFSPNFDPANPSAAVWIAESYSDLVSGVDTLSPMEHKIAGGAGSTTYTGQYVVPVCSKGIRISIKENSVSSNFGVATVYLTVASAGAPSRNLQETSLATGALTIGTVNQGTGGSSAWNMKIDQTGDNNAVDVLTLPTGTVAGSSTLPAGTNLIGYVGHGKTIKSVTGTVSVDTDIVAAVPAKRIKVIAYSLISASTTSNTITFQSNASTALHTTPLQAITGTMTGSNLAISAPSFLFATAAGEKLTLDVSAAQNVTYNVTYFDDDAT